MVSIAKLSKTIKIIGYIIIPLVLIYLPANYFDSGKSICLSVVLLDTTCYGCGMTKAIMHLCHFDFQKAFDYNKLSFIVFPILCFLWVAGCIDEIKKYNK